MPRTALRRPPAARVPAWRAILAFLLLPGIVAFTIPLALSWPALRDQPLRLAGLVPLLAGTGLLLWCVRDFHARGSGTLAPWDPPRHLVTEGLYRVSRNPMYLAVVLILAGWVLMAPSWSVLLYGLAVTLAFHLRVRFHEEPALARTFRDEWNRYAARVPRWIVRSRRAVALAWIGVALALPMAGLIYEAYADAVATRAYPPPGMFVDVGGRRLHLVCLGDGTPTVVFEASGFGVGSISAATAREQIARRTTVCSYDRMGMGWSDPGPASAPSSLLAQDLAVLQDRARLRAPYVLVASSIGGLTAEMFARQYPERVAALVFVDAASSEVLPAAAPWLGRARLGACAAGIAAQFGVIRLLDPFGLRAETTDEARRAAALSYGARPWATMCAIVRGIAANPGAFVEAPPLPPDLPLIVLSASNDEGLFPLSGWIRQDVRAARTRSHQALAQRSTRGAWRVVPDSTHLIANDQPDAVVSAVLALLEARR